MFHVIRACKGTSLNYALNIDWLNQSNDSYITCKLVSLGAGLVMLRYKRVVKGFSMTRELGIFFHEM